LRALELDDRLPKSMFPPWDCLGTGGHLEPALWKPQQANAPGWISALAMVAILSLPVMAA
jgi:hypothetical protein